MGQAGGRWRLYVSCATPAQQWWVECGTDRPQQLGHRYRRGTG